MNELTNLIQFKKEGSDTQLSLKTDLTLNENTPMGVAESILERINEGIKASGQTTSRYTSVVFYDFTKKKKIKVKDLYSVPVPYEDEEVITDEDRKRFSDEY